MQTNYENEIRLFYRVMIKPQLPVNTDLYKSVEQPEMFANYNPTTDKIHFFVKIPRNPIYMIDKLYYDCGEYSLMDILNITSVYDSVKIERGVHYEG